MNISELDSNFKIQTNIDKGLLPANAHEKFPYAEDGLALSYAAADVGNSKAATKAREAAYMESNEPWLKETEVKLLSNDTSGMLKKANEPKKAQEKSYSKKDDSFLNYASAALALASFVPGVDTVTNLLSIPIDLAKGDYGSALLDAVGVIPVLGELADVTKVARKADDISDVVKIAEKVDNIADIGKVDKVTNVVEVGDGVRDVGKVKHSLEITKKISPYQIEPTHSITLSKNKYTELVDDIRKNGVIEPIKYVEHNGTKYVVDGHHRLQAAKELKLKDIPVQEVTLPYKGYKDISDLEWYN